MSDVPDEVDDWEEWEPIEPDAADEQIAAWYMALERAKAKRWAK